MRACRLAISIRWRDFIVYLYFFIKFVRNIVIFRAVFILFTGLRIWVFLCRSYNNITFCLLFDLFFRSLWNKAILVIIITVVADALRFLLLYVLLFLSFSSLRSLVKVILSVFTVQCLSHIRFLLCRGIKLLVWFHSDSLFFGSLLIGHNDVNSFGLRQIKLTVLLLRFILNLYSLFILLRRRFLLSFLSACILSWGKFIS